MHQQIRTSPDNDRPFPDKLKARLDKLAKKNVSIEGVAPEPNSTHILFVVQHRDLEDALDALREWSPTLLPAFTTAVGHRAGGLERIIRELIEAGLAPSSVIVLASREAGADVLVSIGIDRPMTKKEWRDHGGWGELDDAAAS